MNNEIKAAELLICQCIQAMPNSMIGPFPLDQGPISLTVPGTERNVEVMTSDAQIVGLTPAFAVHVSRGRRIRTPDTVKPHYTYLESDEGRRKIVQIL